MILEKLMKMLVVVLNNLGAVLNENKASNFIEYLIEKQEKGE